MMMMMARRKLVLVFLCLVLRSYAGAIAWPRFGKTQPVFARPIRQPYFAIVTERGSCDSEERLQTAIQAIESAVASERVSLVSIRVSGSSKDGFEERLGRLTSHLLSLTKKHSFRVVVSSECVEVGAKAGAHGVHVKESHRPLIPDMLRLFASKALLGTSAHSVESALEAWRLYRPDYFMVGTCYETPSHPEKRVEDLEGPTLPGEVAAALRRVTEHPPPVFAIGGIDETNCHEPVLVHGADGVATIRSVLHASDPASVVQNIVQNMNTTRPNN